MLIALAVGFLALSIVPHFAPAAAFNLPGITIFWTVWCATAIILCDAAAKRMGARSLLLTATGGWRCLLRFVAAGALAGLFLDGTAQWLGKLWIYPYWNLVLYAVCFIVGFCAYSLLIAETYTVTRMALRHGGDPPAAHRSLRSGRMSGMIGAFLAASGLVWAFKDYSAAGGFQFSISTLSRRHASFSCFPLTFVGLWLLLESALARQRKPSLLGALAAGDWLPLRATVLAGAAFGFLMEITNAPHPFWRYTNWPLQRVAPWGIPIVVLVTWPMQYVVFVSLFSLFVAEDLW